MYAFRKWAHKTEKTWGLPWLNANCLLTGNQWSSPLPLVCTAFMELNSVFRKHPGCYCRQSGIGISSKHCFTIRRLLRNKLNRFWGCGATNGESAQILLGFNTQAHINKVVLCGERLWRDISALEQNCCSLRWRVYFLKVQPPPTWKEFIIANPGFTVWVSGWSGCCCWDGSDLARPALPWHQAWVTTTSFRISYSKSSWHQNTPNACIDAAPQRACVHEFLSHLAHHCCVTGKLVNSPFLVVTVGLNPSSP